MNKKKQNNNIKLYIIILIILKTLIYFVDWYFYGFTYKYTNHIQSVLTVSIVTLIFSGKDKSDDTSKISIFLIISTVLIFYFTKPSLTYIGGQKKIISKGYSNIETLDISETRSIYYFDFKIKDTSRVPNAYIYLIPNDSEKKYILLSPYTGEISQENFGEDNYIDDYLDN